MVQNGAAVDELVLQDVSESRLARVAAVIEGLRHERGRGPSVRTTTSPIEAVDGAAVIFCAIRVGGLEGRVVDETVPLREGVLGQETVGPGGICFALRTVPVMLELARIVSDRAPASWFLNFTNPAGLVTEALRDVLGDRVVGICDSPAALCKGVAAALGRRESDLAFEYAGLNHLGWLLAVRDEERNLLPDVLADDRRLGHLEHAKLFGPERLRELGMIPNEYLVYYETPRAVVDAIRRAGVTRAETLLAQQARFYAARFDGPADALAAWRSARDARHGTYMAEAWSAVAPEPSEPSDGNAEGSIGATHEPPPPRNDPHPNTGESDEMGYAAIAAAFLRAVAGDSGETLILNVANRGRLSFLDDDAVVEVPCAVTAAGPKPRTVADLPPAQASLVSRIKEVERATIRAAVEDSRDLALQALVAHPLVPSRDVANTILSGYLAALPDLARRLR